MASEDDRIRSQVGVRGAVERRAFRVALSVSRRRGLRRGRGPGRQGARKRIIGCGAAVWARYGILTAASNLQDWAPWLAAVATLVWLYHVLTTGALSAASTKLAV
jgi:hypothetical protein